MKWNQELNPSQLKAADQINGQLLILAGAGSGKTKTLTHRIAHMIEDGIPSEQILAITFTKKAAGEMKSRISSLLGDVRQPKACTFHSLGFDIVREFPVECGYRKRVSVCDAADSKTRAKEALAEVVTERGYTEDTWSFESDRQGKEIQPYHKDKDVVNAFLEYISKAKDMCQGPIAASDEAYANMGIIVQRGDFQLAYKKYQDELVADNVLDFDDLIMVPVLLLELNEEIANIYWNKYRYISVDEYQDTNNAQFRLVHRLAEGNGNLCVVGDDYQSIYGFRGADISNILNFKNTYPAANIVILGENYRSTHNIVNGASGVIAYNRKQMCYGTNNYLYFSTSEIAGIINACWKVFDLKDTDYFALPICMESFSILNDYITGFENGVFCAERSLCNKSTEPKIPVVSSYWGVYGAAYTPKRLPKCTKNI